MIEITALICAGITFFMAVFHFLLLCGAPLGEYTLGGKNRVIPKEKRYINAIFIAIYLIYITVYLGQTGLITIPINDILLKVLMIIYSLFLTYAIFANLFLTDSKKETILMTPLSIIASISSIATLIYIW